MGTHPLLPTTSAGLPPASAGGAANVLLPQASASLPPGKRSQPLDISCRRGRTNLKWLRNRAATFCSPALFQGSGVVKTGGGQERGFAGNGKLHFDGFARRGRPTCSDYWPGGAVAATRPDKGGDQLRGNTVNRVPRGPHQAQILAARKPTAGSHTRRKPEHGKVLTAPRGIMTSERGILTVPGVAQTPARAFSSLPSELRVLTAAGKS